MEYWDTFPSESDLSFAQTTQSSIPIDSDWRGSCIFGDVPLLQAETTQKSLLEAKHLPAPEKLLPHMTSNHVSPEMLPQVKNVKTEHPLSSRCRQYGGWLQGLREIANELPSRQETLKSSESKNARLPELLKFVMVELEHKLALDDLKTHSSECSFWASVQAMAKKCGIDFCEFERLCCASEFKDVTHTSDSGIPRLVDQGLDESWGGLATYSSVGYSNRAFNEVFQQFPLRTAKDDPFATPNLASFGQLPFSKFQRHTYPSLLGSKHPELGHLCAPGSGSLYSTFSTSKAPVLPDSVVSKAPSKKRSPSVHFKNKNPQIQFPATVPEACRRRIQRQRKRAISYDHLSTNFGASESSLLWNTNVSDLQFLLEKVLKPSDVGSLGRIILPKRQAEEKLPRLETKEGMKLNFQDLQTSQNYQLRFRFWPNNKTRMYLLEHTGEFVKTHHLQEGDFVMLYWNPSSKEYMINGKKAAWSKCLGTSERRGLPLPSATGGNYDKCRVESVASMPKAPENECVARQLPVVVKEADPMDSDMWNMQDPDELIKEFCEMEANGKSIDELFDFKE